MVDVAAVSVGVDRQQDPLAVDATASVGRAVVSIFADDIQGFALALSSREGHAARLRVHAPAWGMAALAEIGPSA